jgi:EmrB/QacA subfamily drug resistance transporter
MKSSLGDSGGAAATLTRAVTTGDHAVASPTRPAVAPSRAMPPAGPPARPSRLGSSGAWGLSLAVLITGTFVSVLDTSVVNVAMTVLRKEFGVSTDSIQWISTVYNLAEGVVVPTSAWLGARFGLKRVYLVALVLFTAASALCGMSSSLAMLILFRVVQAIPGGVLPVVAQTILYRVVPKQRLGAAMGIYGVGVVVAPAVGPSVGGFLIDNLGWRYIFFINVPIGLLGAAAAAFVLRPQRAEQTRPFDLPGFLSVGTALFALLLALEEGSKWGWTSYPILILFAVAVNLLALFVAIELQVRHPLLDLRALVNRRYATSVVLIACLFIVLNSVMFYIPLFLQSVRGLSALDAGMLLLPQGLVMAVLMPIAGTLFDKFGARWLALVGFSLTAVGVYLLSHITVDVPDSRVVLGLVVMAAGLGLAMMPMMTSGLSALASTLTASGSAISTLAQRISGAFGLAILTALVTADRAQFWADRAPLVPGMGADTAPRVAEMKQQGTSGLVALWQQLSNEVQTQAYGNALLVAAAVAGLGVLMAFFMPSGRPAAGADKPMVH